MKRSKKRSITSQLAAALCTVSILGILLTFVLAYLNDGGLVLSGLPVLTFTSAVVGYLIAARQPRNSVGWIFLFGALLSAIRGVSGQYAIYGLLTTSGSIPLAELSAWLAVVFRVPGPVLSFIVLPLFFPNGKVPSPGWKVVVWIVLLTATLTTVFEAFAPGVAVYGTGIQNPLGIESLSFYAEKFFNGGPLIFWFVGLMFVAGASLVFRYRDSGTVERQQIKWLTLAAVLIPVWFSVSESIEDAFPLVFAVVDSLIIAAVPVAAGIAILRYRLYDIDFIINKTIVYTAMTVLIVAVYAIFVGSLEYLIRFITGENSQLAIVVSTLAIAALFNPFRRLVQRFVDRRFYRRKYNARATLDDFSGRLRDETGLENLTNGLAAVVEKTMRPEHVSIMLLSVGDKRQSEQPELRTSSTAVESHEGPRFK